MKLQSGVSKRSRQERALERRREEFNQWVLDPTSVKGCDLSYMTPERRADVVASKIEKAKEEIATLERRLGIVYTD